MGMGIGMLLPPRAPPPLLPLLLLPLLPLLLVVAAAPSSAETCQTHLPLPSSSSSPYHRQITTPNPNTQALYDQALLLTAAFNHDEAVRSLEAALEEDPACLSCYTGIAAALSPNINRPVITQEALDKATAAVNHALVLRSFDYAAVEVALANAMSLRFPLERNLTNGAVYDEVYAQALAQVRKDYPQDVDVAVWWCEAAMTTMPWAYYDDEEGNLKSLSKEIKTVLEEILVPPPEPLAESTISIRTSHSPPPPPSSPLHPLALHLYIHLLEPSSSHTNLQHAALPAANALRNLTKDMQLGPGCGHLIHMPGHIYLRVGDYHQASMCNIEAIENDREYFEMCGIETETGTNTHAHAHQLVDEDATNSISRRSSRNKNNEGEEDNYNFYYRALYFTHKHAFLLFSAGMEGRKDLVLQTAEELESECDIFHVAKKLEGSFWAYPQVWKWLVHDLRFGEWETAAQATAEEEAPFFAQTMQHFVRAFALASGGGGGGGESESGSEKEGGEEGDEGKCVSALREAELFYAKARNETEAEVDVFLVKAGDLYDVAKHVLQGRLASRGCLVKENDNKRRRRRRIGGTSSPSLLRTTVANSDTDTDTDISLHAWQQAVALVDAFPYMEPPFWPLNPRACLGQVLLDAGRYEEAANAYLQDLTRWPENGWSLKGLEAALRGQGKDKEAEGVRVRFERAFQYAEVDLGGRSCF